MCTQKMQMKVIEWLDREELHSHMVVLCESSWWGKREVLLLTPKRLLLLEEDISGELAQQFSRPVFNLYSIDKIPNGGDMVWELSFIKPQRSYHALEFYEDIDTTFTPGDFESDANAVFQHLKTLENRLEEWRARCSMPQHMQPAHDQLNACYRLLDHEVMQIDDLPNAVYVPELTRTFKPAA